MVKLANEDIKTREVLDWKGLHVFHFSFSSCSQKLRIFLNLKDIEWEPHLIDLMANQNLTDHFLGINPRGLVPVLVHDGDVHIESNDIITYLESVFPEPRLIPEGLENNVSELLKHEDDLHLDLRALSFRFVFNPPHNPKSPEDLKVYATAGSGTVRGEPDQHAGVEIDFWEQYASEGITDEAAKSAVAKFRDIFAQLDNTLAGQDYLLAEGFSVLDIAWFISVNRLILTGYPIGRLHSKLGAWYDRLAKMPEIAKEVALPPRVKEKFDATRAQHLADGVHLEAVVGL